MRRFSPHPIFFIFLSSFNEGVQWSKQRTSSGQQRQGGGRRSIYMCIWWCWGLQSVRPLTRNVRHPLFLAVKLLFQLLKIPCSDGSSLAPALSTHDLCRYNRMNGKHMPPLQASCGMKISLNLMVLRSVFILPDLSLWDDLNRWRLLFPAGEHLLLCIDGRIDYITKRNSRDAA